MGTRTLQNDGGQNSAPQKVRRDTCISLSNPYMDIHGVVVERRLREERERKKSAKKEGTGYPIALLKKRPA